MYVILDKDFSTYYLLETRALVYTMATFSGTPTYFSEIMRMSSP